MALTALKTLATGLRAFHLRYEMRQRLRRPEAVGAAAAAVVGGPEAVGARQVPATPQLHQALATPQLRRALRARLCTRVPAPMQEPG